VLFLNLGDSYASQGGPLKEGGGINDILGGKKETQDYNRSRQAPVGLKPKDLCGIPWRVALALQADGAADYRAAQIIDSIMSRLADRYQENEQPMPAFVRRELEFLHREYVQAKEGSWWLRSDIIWAKPNPMPESCTDRPTTAHEHIFLLTKSAKYFWDGEAVREEGCGYGRSERFRDDKYSNNASFDNSKSWENSKGGGKSSHDGSGRNLRNVWTIATAPFPQAHFATFPPAIPERCIKAGTSEKGCCPRCLAPWRRVVEKKASTMNIRVRDTKKGIMQHKTPGFGATEDEIANYGKEEMGQSTTTGWAPTCGCKEGYWEKEHGVFIENQPYNPIPCTVLDPFSGAGTTALVAAKLGRDAIGIELNPAYVEMSRKRIAGELGMLCKVEVICP
jgi:DNA modification methylase